MVRKPIPRQNFQIYFIYAAQQHYNPYFCYCAYSVPWKQKEES